MKKILFFCIYSFIIIISILFFLNPKIVYAGAETLSFSNSNSVTTASGYVGDTTFTIYLTGGAKNTTFTFYWDSTSTGTTVNLGTCATTGDDTTCNTSITIPSSSEGDWIIHSNSSDGDGANTLTFTVNPKIINSTPSSGNYQTSITVTGTGFAAETVSVLLGTYTLGTDTPTSGTGGTQGNLSVTANAPAMPQGSKAVSASGALSGTVTSAFTFTMNPTITISSDNGNPGATTDVSGNGFAASSTITIAQDGSATSTTGSSDSTGSFTNITYTPIGASGNHTINAKDASNNSAIALDYAISGALSITNATNTNLSIVTLSYPTPNSAGSLGVITVYDSRGTNVGWSLTASATHFSQVNNAVLVSGTNTMTSGGTYDYPTGGVYIITITSGGGNAKFNVSGLETATDQAIGTNVAIGTHGVTATFSTPPYSVGDSWTIKVDTIPIDNNGYFTINPNNGTFMVVSGSGTGVSVGSSHPYTSTSDNATIMTASSGNGNGTYSVNPGLTLTVPVGTFYGNYVATLTETVL